MEVELRARVSSYDKLLQQLSALTDKQVDGTESKQVDTYLVHSNDKDRKLVIRFRSIEGKPENILTFKGSSQAADDVAWPDYDTVIKNADQLEMLLLGNGYKRLCIIEKLRVTFNIDGLEINLDRVSNLGNFVEIEGYASTNEQIPEVLEILKSWLGRLGIVESDIVRKGYVSLMLEKNII